jgi:hypothetical protein
MLILKSRALDISRRRLLVKMAVGTAAFGGLQGCAPGQAEAQLAPDCPDLILRDLPLLESLAIMEGIAEDTYRAAAGIMTPDTRPAALAWAEHHRLHRQSAVDRLLARDFAEPERLPLTHLPELPAEASEAGDAAILAYALGVEMQAVNAYMGLISQFAAPELRIQAAEIMACEVAHVVALRAILPEPIGAGGILPAVDFSFFSDLGKSED